MRIKGRTDIFIRITCPALQAVALFLMFYPQVGDLAVMNPDPDSYRDYWETFQVSSATCPRMFVAMFLFSQI